MTTAVRFTEADHTYTCVETGEVLPSITQMLKTVGLVNDEFYTAASAARGTAIHHLCNQHDYGTLDLATCDERYRGWVKGYSKALAILRPEILAIEEAMAHPTLRFAGRPDRDVRLNGVRGVIEIKSGAACKSHPIQTALQCILVAQKADLPPEALGRWCIYPKATGKFSFVEFRDRRDFYQAYDIIKRCT